MKSRAKGSGPEPYDFRRPTKLSREHIRTLQIAYEAFAKQYTTLLTSTLRVVSQVNLLSIKQLTYDEYISSLEATTLMALVEMDPLPGTSVFELSLNTAMAFVDHMLGGTGGKQPERPLTEIEARLVQGLLDRVLHELQETFEPITEIHPKIVGIEYNPQFVQVATTSDAMIVASFEMRIGKEECVATISMPFGSIFAKLQGEPGGPDLTDEQRATRDAALRSVTAGLHEAEIDVAVRFRSVTMNPAELVALTPGDVITLPHAVTVPLTVTSDNRIFAYAVPGSSGRRLACLVVQPPQEDE